MNKYAVIDIGSLKVKYLLARTDEKGLTLLVKDSKLTLLGKGIKSDKHKVHSKSLKDTIEAVKGFIEISQKNKAKKTRIIATESIRKAENVKEVMNTFVSELNQEPEIINQREEAEVFHKAVMKDFQGKEEYCIVDMGGGSVQVISGSKSKIENVEFLPLGVYLLQQKFVSDKTEDGGATRKELNSIEKHIQDVIENSRLLKNTKNPIIYGSSNVLDLMKFIEINLEMIENSLSHPYKTNTSSLLEFLDIIADKTHREREEEYPFQWGYMWGIQMAFLNMIYLARHVGTDIIIPSNVNIAEGYILEMLEK